MRYIIDPNANASACCLVNCSRQLGTRTWHFHQGGPRPTLVDEEFKKRPDPSAPYTPTFYKDKIVCHQAPPGRPRMCVSGRPGRCLFQTKPTHWPHFRRRCRRCCRCRVVAVVTVTQAAVAGILPEATATSRPGALRAAGRAVNLEPSTQSQSHKRPEVEIWSCALSPVCVTRSLADWRLAHCNGRHAAMKGATNINLHIPGHVSTGPVR